MVHASADGKFTAGHFIYRVFIAALVGSAIIGACNLSSLINPKLGVFVYGFSLLMVILIMYLPLLLKSDDIRESVQKSGGESDFATVLVGVILSSVLFGLLCREMFEVFAANFSGGRGAGWRDWIGFGFDNLLEAVFFDVTSVYELSFADIVPQSFWTRFLLVSFRILIDIVILQGLFTIFTVVRENNREEARLAAARAAEQDEAMNTGPGAHRD